MRKIIVGGNQGRGDPLAFSTEGTLSEPIRDSNVFGTCGWLLFSFFSGFAMGWLLATQPIFR